MPLMLLSSQIKKDEKMAETVYLLCACLSILCAVMLFRGYLKGRTGLLLWCSLCFGFLALNNIILYVDLSVIPQIDFEGGFWRNLLGSIAGTLMLYGLIWELT